MLSEAAGGRRSFASSLPLIPPKCFLHLTGGLRLERKLFFLILEAPHNIEVNVCWTTSKTLLVFVYLKCCLIIAHGAHYGSCWSYFLAHISKHFFPEPLGGCMSNEYLNVKVH